MNEPTVPVPPPPVNPDLDAEYLLRELEFQVILETRARDRMENMVQYLLATIAAVIGAALLVSELRVNGILLGFIASLLVFVSSISAYYRSCRLRYIITYARVNRNNVRCSLTRLGARDAERLIQWEGNPSGFGPKMMVKLFILLVLSSLLGGLTSVFFLLLLFQVQDWALSADGRLVILIAIPILFTLLLATALGAVVRNQKTNSERFISDPGWRNLPDYDL